ncbi:MAG: ROK family protein [Saprospiraceae bacterium]|nr:ROK family protein [Saprospiraceae bacterium]
MEVLGIDVGGTGIKGNIVDTDTGALIGEKFKIKTPTPATPEAIIECLKQMVEQFKWHGKKIGIGFPSVIKNGYSLTASNIDPAFINYHINHEFSLALGCDVKVVNDADAAGIAEITYGKGKGVNGLVIFITLGTGIGSAVFYNGQLLGNTELGHLKYKKSIFEKYASNSARELKHLGWKKWAKELNVYLNHLDLLLSPQLILIGGGVSKFFDQYTQYLDVKTKVDNAALFNDAGIVGAAMAAV